jgi:glutaredoxin-like protein
MLLSDRDRATVSAHLQPITRRVTLLLFTRTIGASESTDVARRVVTELAGLNDKISVDEVNVVLDKERAAQFGIEHDPAIVVLADGEDTRMRFLGAPAGYEFMSLIEAVTVAGTGESGLSDASKALLAEHVDAPLDIQVFVTPTCPHCPRAVTLAHRMAIESPHVRATCVEATEFLDLSHRFRVTGVPKTVVNESTEILGALPEDQFIRAILDPGEPEPPSPA